MNYIIRDIIDGEVVYKVRRTKDNGKYEYFTKEGQWVSKLTPDCLCGNTSDLVTTAIQKGLPYLFHIQTHTNGKEITYSCVKLTISTTEWLYSENYKYKFGTAAYHLRAKLESKNEVRNIVKEITEAEKQEPKEKTL